MPPIPPLLLDSVLVSSKGEPSDSSKPWFYLPGGHLDSVESLLTCHYLHICVTCASGSHCTMPSPNQPFELCTCCSRVTSRIRLMLCVPSAILS